MLGLARSVTVLRVLAPAGAASEDLLNVGTLLVTGTFLVPASDPAADAPETTRLVEPPALLFRAGFAGEAILRGGPPTRRKLVFWAGDVII
jgi:hypothetical protein